MFKANIREAIHRIQSKRNPPISEAEAIRKSRDNFRKPLVELLILTRLSQNDSYSYEIAQSVKKTSGGRFHIPEGSMYPTLYRMIGRGYITDYQSSSEKNQLRVYYQITPAGRAHLKALIEAYEDACEGCQSCLGTMGNASRKQGTEGAIPIAERRPGQCRFAPSGPLFLF